jgi:hypothetical protein
MSDEGNSLVWSDVLRRLRRGGSWADLAVGTAPRIEAALRANDFATVSQLADFFLVEARVIFDLYAQWLRDIRSFLEAKLPGSTTLAAQIGRIETLAGEYHPILGIGREAAWRAVEESTHQLRSAAARGERAIQNFERMRDDWRALHDGEVDIIGGLMDIVIRELGEDALGEMYDWLLGDWFRQRYVRFDVSKVTWNEAFELIVYLTFESMHGHMSGPARDGSVSYEEFDDRITVTFAPCGSGGRTLVGERRDGLPPLTEPPFNYGVLQEQHAFAWNTRGVCAYCAHCCVLTEKMPIEQFGYPVRVVDPPTYPNDGNAVCKWTVYRKPEFVPEHVYARLGASKPPAGAQLGSAGFAARLREPSL